METITKTIYKSNDGKEFDTEKECLEYESKNSFEKWYSKNSLSIPVDNGEDDYNHYDVYFWTIFEWLLKNKKEIINFLFPSDFIFLQELKSLIKKPLDVQDSDDVGIFLDDLENLIQRYEKILENKI